MSFRDVRGFRFAALAAIWAGVGGCGSPPPSAVDEEALLVDIEICARGEPECEREGVVDSHEMLVPGKHTVVLAAPARISLPIRAHSDDAQLAWIAIGVSAGGPGRELRVKIGDDETAVQPVEGPARVEVSGRDRRIAPGTRLELIAIRGGFTIAWVVGRWKR